MYYVFMNNLALSEIYEISFKIISNIVILLAIILGYSFINYELKGNTRVNRIIFGVITGVASILIMSNPWSPVPGLIVDTRTILFVIVGLHFGLTPSTI